MSTRPMRTERPGKTSLHSVLLAAILVAACQGDSISQQYSRMAAVGQYLIVDSGAEIALARSAAPPAIAQDATVLILGKDGYKTAVDGKNGFNLTAIAYSHVFRIVKGNVPGDHRPECRIQR